MRTVTPPAGALSTSLSRATFVAAYPGFVAVNRYRPQRGALKNRPSASEKIGGSGVASL
jgi:hypothetical protein